MMRITNGRTTEEMSAVRLMLAPFKRGGYELFPLAKGQKIPRDKGWRTTRYGDGELKRWVQDGGNVGIRLRDTDLVLDVDPRNFPPGDDPFQRLCKDVDAALSVAPTVLSGRGDGGRHIYFLKPASVRIVGKLDAYPGIDFRSAGSLVVAAGSRHPDTGGTYEVDEITPPITEVRPAPGALLKLIARPDQHDAGERAAGLMTPEQMAEMLAVLDPEDYSKGEYDKWIRLAAACHDATGGAGLPEFLAWCAGDNVYNDDVSQEQVERHWNSFKSGKPGGATYRTLLKAVVDAGYPELVAAFDDDDALDENFLVYEVETEPDDG
jgi:hypothetical protein